MGQSFKIDLPVNDYKKNGRSKNFQNMKAQKFLVARSDFFKFTDNRNVILEH